MEKPKSVWILIFLWVIILVFILIHCWNWHIQAFIQPEEDLKDVMEERFSYALNIIFLILSLIIIYSIYIVKKWSWLLNIIFLVHFLFYYGAYFFQTIFYMVFYINYASRQDLYSNPHFIAWTISCLLIPFVIAAACYLLLFNSKVKKYLNKG